MNRDISLRKRASVFWRRNYDGSVAAEFALVAPVLVLIVAGITDFAMLATKSVSLAAATQIGAAYARLHPLDTSGIQNAMQNAMDFAPPLTFPTTVLHSCECDDGSTIACSESCATVGRPAPNRVFIKVSAAQAFTPLLPWPGIPATLNAATELRLQ